MKKLIATADSGIADRISLMLASKRLADDIGCEFEFYWPVNDWGAATFSEMFMAIGFNVVDKPEDTPLTEFEGTSWEEVRNVVKASADEVIKIHSFGAPYHAEDFGPVVALSADVRYWATKFVESSGFAPDTIGCHVRGTDYLWRMPRLDDY